MTRAVDDLLGPGVVTGNQFTSKAELDRRAAQVATGLRSLGVGPGAPVAEIGRNGVVHLEVAMAAAQLGNVLLSHADRSRFGLGQGRRLAGTFGPAKGSVLVDGEVAAMWHPEHDKPASQVTLVVEHAPLAKKASSSLEAAAQDAVRFLHAGGARHDVRLVALN